MVGGADGKSGSTRKEYFHGLVRSRISAPLDHRWNQGKEPGGRGIRCCGRGRWLVLLDPGNQGLIVHAVHGRKARGTQAAAPVGINHGFFLFRSVAQAADPIGLQNGFVHRCHRLVNYDAYEIRRPESSSGAVDPAYVESAASWLVSCSKRSLPESAGSSILDPARQTAVEPATAKPHGRESCPQRSASPTSYRPILEAARCGQLSRRSRRFAALRHRIPPTFLAEEANNSNCCKRLKYGPSVQLRGQDSVRRLYCQFFISGLRAISPGYQGLTGHDQTGL